MIRRIVWTAMMVVAMGSPVRFVAAEILAVPPAIRRLPTPKDERLVVRSPDGVALGEQHVHAAVDHDRLQFDIVTRFTSGEEWDEHGEMDLGAGFRSRQFAKVMRRDGRVVQEQRVDFTTGKVEWLVDGVRAERTMTFAPDTYIGPMLGIVLAGVPEQSPAATRFEALVFRPDPMVVTLRAEATDEEQIMLGQRATLATKLRVKADLGPIKNVMFASLIPTHYFWFTRTTEPELVGFRGRIANGLEVAMTPEATATTTAHAREPRPATR